MRTVHLVLASAAGIIISLQPFLFTSAAPLPNPNLIDAIKEPPSHPGEPKKNLLPLPDGIHITNDPNAPHKDRPVNPEVQKMSSGILDAIRNHRRT
ncbi:hypothetical protein H0H93_003427 [Arthromyces matolae]|nr:hypothetical protein H0H93_003427 [Arthromyces matolae]